MPKIDSISKWGAYGYADAVVDGKKYRRDLIFLPDGTVEIRPGGHGWWGNHNFKGEELEDYIISTSPTIRKKIEESYEDYLEKGGVSLDSVIAQLENRVAKKVRR